ncbi:hypothetical protein BH23ACT8_BH23ACT8_22200 [soil metagenome]
MSVEPFEAAPGVPAILLESESLAVTVLPGKGCDVYALVDRETGVDVLFKSPWGLRRPGPGAHPPDSMAHWLENYPGGWQLLLPNAGGPTVEHGVEWGFHGEACLVPWKVDQLGETDVTLSAELFRAPLRLRRRLIVEGPVLRIEESVTNRSPDPIEFIWGHHPAFGAPFVERGCVLSTGARTLTADGVAPGSMLEAGSTHQWPSAKTAAGEPLDLTVVPGPGDVRSHFAYLSDFRDPYFAITNPRLGFGVGLRWPLEVFPYAWFWQEVHALPGYPWFRQAYTVAVEPNSTVPAQGLAAVRKAGGSVVTLNGGASRDAVLEAVVFRGTGVVDGIEPGGAVRLAADS